MMDIKKKKNLPFIYSVQDTELYIITVHNTFYLKLYHMNNCMCSELYEYL